MLRAQDIAKMIDHALLRPDMTAEEVRAGCQIARQYECRTVCIKPCDVAIAVEELAESDVSVSTVIGFPHGSNLTAVKVLESEMAILQGCKELDMVLNIGRLVGGDYDYVEHDIRTVCETAHKRGAIVKVIFENAYLSADQIAQAAQIAEQAGADYIKTSTGFGPHGALLEDLRIMKGNVSDKVKLKAAGGVRTLDDALAALAAGCTRIGASATAKIVDEARRLESEGRLEIPAEPTGLAIK